jgi:hypothetical protein
MTGNPVDTLMDISIGFTVPRTLHVIAELGVADALDETPRTATELAATTGANAGALHRALRALAAHGVFRLENGCFGHTPASRLLRADHPQSMRAFVRMQGMPVAWRAWEELDYSIRTGRPASEKSVPNGFWSYFESHPEHGRLFNDAMTAKTRGQTAGMLTAYDFSAFRTIADIGGGNGYLLSALLDAAPGATGVLFELPHVIEQIASIASDRLKLHAGDFFKDALPTADAYVLMQVLHDWSDTEAASILRGVRRAAPPHAKLLLAEWLLPDNTEPNWAFMIDLIMLAWVTGKERTNKEFEALLSQTGLRLDRVIDAGAHTFILEASVV